MLHLSHAMICGTASFKHVDEDLRTPPSSPKPAKKKPGKNLFSARGLDKYSAVVAELEARKAKIMEKVGTHETSSTPMVWFVCSDAGDWTPIVVRLREAKEEDKRPCDAKKPPSPPAEANSELAIKEAAPANNGGAGAAAETAAPAAPERKSTKSFSWGLKEVKEWSWRNWRLSCSWPLVLLLILVCLLMFGRMFAICCTTICWYLVPLMEGTENASSLRSLKKKRDHKRRMRGIATAAGGHAKIARRAS